MTYDEFAEKLRKISVEFKTARGRDLQTVAELNEFLVRRLTSKKSKALRSLKGIGTL